MNESAYVVVERNTIWEGEAASEPYEVGWAKEAIVFIQCLDETDTGNRLKARMQISPDGVRWCDEGSTLPLSLKPGEVSFARIQNFGGWLRVIASLPDGVRMPILVSMHLKA